MTLPSLRLAWFGGMLIAAGLVLNSYWLELHDGIQPCLLCSMQRFAFLLLAVLFLLGTLCGNARRWVHALTGLLSGLVSASGVWLAGRQVWLQWQPPDQSADCGVSMGYLFKVLPLNKALTKIISGSAECSRVAWTFLNLSLAEWSLVFFVVLLALSLIQGVRALRR